MHMPEVSEAVNLTLRQAPNRILLKCGGETVEWSPADIASTHAGVFLFIADMSAHGWTALRSGDAIILHPIYDATPQHLRWLA